MREIDIERIHKYGLNPADFEPQKKPDENEPTQTDRIEAQVMYTALMTDTLLIEEE